MVTEDDRRFYDLSYGFLDTTKLKMYFYEDNKLTYIPIVNFNLPKLPVKIMHPHYHENHYRYYRYFLIPFLTPEEIMPIYQTLNPKNKNKKIFTRHYSILYDNSAQGFTQSMTKNYQFLMSTFSTLDEIQKYEKEYNDELEAFYDFYIEKRVKILERNYYLKQKFSKK